MEQSEQCEGVAKEMGDPTSKRGKRCPERATVRLFNGSRMQGKACEECARRMLNDFAFLKAQSLG